MNDVLQDAREAVANVVGYHMAAVVSGNNQPCMSGDPRDRIGPGKRRWFDDACRGAADAAIAALRESGWCPAVREEPTTFGECPPGLFLFGGTLCFKSEYHTKVNQPDAYVVSSGEYFWGGTVELEARLSLVVIPLAAAPEPPA